jgi:pilus assembly protein CpaB
MQNRRGTLYLLLAVVSGLSAVVLARNWLQRQIPIIPVGTDTTPVLIANGDLPAGVPLTGSGVDVFDWPSDHLPDGAISERKNAVGRVLKRAVVEGEPLLESGLLRAGSEAGLHALIGKNRRAMSVKVDAVVGVAGWVKPGTRVDVLATLRRVDWDRPLPYSRVILQDITVLANDQKLEEADEGEAEIVSVVTLEVDPSQAQKLAYANSEGSLQLALRNPEDSRIVDTVAVTVGDVVPVKLTETLMPSVSTARPATNGHRTSIEAIRGASVTKELL